MIPLATFVGVALFALGLLGPAPALMTSGSILLGATMITVQLARLQDSASK